MAGYNGWSMSNNAVAAYEDGEKPLSKWTKADIFDAIKEQEKTTLSGSTSCRRMCRKGGFPCLSNVIHNA